MVGACVSCVLFFVIGSRSHRWPVTLRTAADTTRAKNASSALDQRRCAKDSVFTCRVIVNVRVLTPLFVAEEFRDVVGHISEHGFDTGCILALTLMVLLLSLLRLSRTYANNF